MATTMDAQTSTATSSSTLGAAGGGKKLPLAAIAAGGVLVVAVAAWFVSSSGKRKEQFAAQALMQARQSVDIGNLPQASAEFQKVANTFKGTHAAQEAILALNQNRIILGQHQIAAQGLREFLAQSPAADLVAPANALLGTALENATLHAEAAAAYLAASAAAEVDYLKAEYLTEAGRAYLDAGLPAEAEKAYREVMTKYPKTPSMTEAEVRLGELTKGRM